MTKRTRKDGRHLRRKLGGEKREGGVKGELEVLG
jgi:hypothetical protein